MNSYLDTSIKGTQAEGGDATAGHLTTLIEMAKSLKLNLLPTQVRCDVLCILDSRA
jgi:hypothetical protein